MKRYETYKDSGILWLDAIPSHWHEEKLKHISTCNDEVLSEDTPDEQIIHYVEISDVDSVSGINNHTDYMFANAPSRARRITRKNDVIISTVRTYLKAIATVKEDDLIVSTGFAVIRPTKVNQKYLAYSLLNDDFLGEVISKSVGVSYPAINATDLIEIKIPVPPREEQETITTFLDHKVGQIDATIAEKEQMLEDLKAYRSAIISEAVTKGLDKNVEMKDSGIEWIGIIPKTWKIVRIKHILDYKTDSLRVGPFGSSLSGNDFKTEGYWVYSQRVVLDNNFNSNDTFVSQEKYKELSSFKVFAGDILLTTRGTIGKVAIVPNTFHEGVLHPCLIRFRVDDSIVNKDFLAYYFNDTNLILDQVKYNSNSTTIDVIYSYTLKELIVSLPPLDVQNDIVAHLNYKVQKIDEMLKEASQSVENLKSYKSTLITEAVTGKIDLRDWKPKEEKV